jgi:hypothetical protein
MPFPDFGPSLALHARERDNPLYPVRQLLIASRLQKLLEIPVTSPTIPKAQIPDFTSAEDFFFRTPPYDPVQLTVEQVRVLFASELKLDGFCPYCKTMRTFTKDSGRETAEWHAKYGPEGNSPSLSNVSFHCTRHDHHRIHFDFRMYKGQLQKTGQWPSFADIAMDESKQYSKILSKLDAAEFHRAIGLASHNVGIGSFVYLRRIFERLITNRFEEFKAAENWKDEDFYAVRMEDKIQLLKNHLPPFLVKNHKIYSILSIGIHALQEDQCLAFFKVLRQSLILILEEDKKKREELEMQHELEKAISGFSNPAVQKPTTQMTLANLAPNPPEPQNNSTEQKE